jgi:alanyl aminopeptidase
MLKGTISASVCALALFCLSCGSKPAVEKPTPTAAPRKVAVPALRLGESLAPIKQRIDLTLDPESTAFSGATEIDVTIDKPTDVIWLNGTGLTIKEASLEIEGQRFELTPVRTANEDFIGLAAASPVGPAPARIHIEYNGKIELKDFLGIFQQKERDRFYLFTQFESIGARRAFPCFDEPRFKIPYQVTLRVPTGLLAAANTPILSEEGDDTTDLTTFYFAETKPLPSYLVAFAVGSFDVVDLGRRGRNRIPLRILTPAGQAGETAYAAEVTGTILERLEDYFDQPYPYTKLDSVAVPHFLGAMENPGLVTYASDLILAKPGEDTAGSKRSYASVAAHELAHQWFGNLVTTAWWDDLWLNESFATWMASKLITEWQPEWDGELSRASSQNAAMRADSLMSARKIRQEIRANHDIFNAFDGISYGKGAAVLTMYENWIGAAAFRAAVQDYMARHAHATATAKDFLESLGRASKEEVPASMSSYLEQAGVPLVHMGLRCENGEPPTLVLEQERFLPAGSEGNAQSQIWQVPVCVKYGHGKASPMRQCTLLKDRTATLALESKSCPDWVLGNADATGYYRVDYQATLAKNLLAVEKRLSGAERISTIGNLRALVAADKAKLGDTLTWSLALARESKRQLVDQSISIIAGIDDMVPADLEANYQRLVQKTFGQRARRLGFLHRQSDDDDTRFLRKSVVSLVAKHDPVLQKQAKQLALGFLEDKTSLPADMREVVFSAAARGGDVALYETFLDAAKKESDREHRELLIDAVADFLQPELVQRNLDLFMTDTFDFREAMGLLYAPLREPALRPLVWNFVKTNYAALVAKLPKYWGKGIIHVAEPFCDDEHRADAEAFFKDKVEAIPGGPRALAQTVEDMKLCSAYRAAQTPSLRAFLTAQ